MGCGCGKKNLVPTTTAEAEAMVASGGGGTFRYEVVNAPDADDQRFTSYVAAKSFQRKNGGKIQALDY